ncbi:MraY family glycosyltransferase [Sulfurirhabdus autotrophica]|uniref:UDP-GlcNAc:undecaprenyl-phosphate GlcNAc-1-phosphate transferase n=1 Tax=Sulfurirhabdus autotrophica TaxID=1706046 RepID=A0A4R3XT09_9PROT|nr:MraY family glycosyltransferase [Sulfurirhabdus autotrophica]TCV79111.1 UDP-GlcNAc:undecaprenyl-phosphate GlcNAc-1-phosphate transferase [Sulfurirhabdus autotrophica]
MSLFFSFIIAVFVTMVLIPPLMRYAELLRIVDIPDGRKVHTGAIPRIGGVAMVIGALIPMIMWLPPETEIISFLLGIGIILFFGVWDDRKNLDYRLKFLGQIIAVLIVVVYGGLKIKYIPFMGTDPVSDYVSIPLTVFALLGITNAINLADGLDGLAGGTTMLSLGMIAILSYMVDGMNLTLMAISVMGCILGFLRFNTYPASIFMGDGGSQFLGFAAGVLAILLTQVVNPVLSPAVAILILGLPILDTFMVMSQRLYERRSPFSPDKNHIHHKLLALGFDHYEAVLLIYLTQSILVLGAFFLRFESDVLVFSTYLMFCAAVIVFFRVALNTGWRMHVYNGEKSNSLVARGVLWLRQDYRLLKAVFYFSIIAITCYLLFAAMLVEFVSIDISLLSLFLFTVLIVLFFKQKGKPFSVVERAITFVAAAFVVYLVQVVPGVLSEYELYLNIFFLMLAVAIGIGFRFSHTDRFRITPLDFLVIFIAVAVPNLPDSHIEGAHWGEGVAKLIVLFYGMELVLTNILRRWDVMRFVIGFTLLMLGVRGVLI